MGTNAFNGGNNTFWSMKFDDSNNRLYVGGAFLRMNDASNRDLSANRIAYWNTTTRLWNTLGNSTQANTTNNGLNQLPYAFIIDNSGNLYVGGAFSIVNDSSASNISSSRQAVWNPQTNRWIRQTIIQNGTGNTVNAITLDTSNQIIYVGGSFTTVSDVSNASYSSNYVTRWNAATQRWEQLGQGANNGTNSTCFSLAYDSSNSRIYVSGNFTTTSDASNVGQSANYITETSYRL